MRWAGHLARIGQTRNTPISVAKTDTKRILARPQCRWHNIKIILMEGVEGGVKILFGSR